MNWQLKGVEFSLTSTDSHVSFGEKRSEDFIFMNVVKENYKKYAYAQEEFFGKLSGNVLIVQQHIENNKLIIDFDRFKQLMNGDAII